MYKRHGNYSFIQKATVSFLICLCLALSYMYVIYIEGSRYQHDNQMMDNVMKESFCLNDSKGREHIKISCKQLRLVQHKTRSSKTETDKRFNETHTPFNLDDTGKRRKMNDTKIKVKQKIKIVVYFPRQARLSNQINELQMNKCENKNCLVQRIMFEISGSFVDADAIVLQGNNMPQSLPERRDPEQVFVFLNNEPPMYIQLTNLNKKSFFNYFNWTMTYRTDSDIPLLYGQIVHRSKNLKGRNKMKIKGSYPNDINTVREKNYTLIFRNKSKNVLWIVSHCQTNSKREKYVHQMRNYTKIDQYGSCNKQSVKNQALDEMSKQYQFYLAFENTFCNDYITEKVFSWYARDIVLVVRGGCDYSKFLPAGTYINANKFTTPVELAKYLTELGKNEREYIRILKRKDKYRVITEYEMVQLAFCELCNRLNNVSEYRKSVANIYTWWQVNSCWKPKDLGY